MRPWLNEAESTNQRRWPAGSETTFGIWPCWYLSCLGNEMTESLKKKNQLSIFGGLKWIRQRPSNTSQLLSFPTSLVFSSDCIHFSFVSSRFFSLSPRRLLLPPRSGLNSSLQLCPCCRELPSETQTAVYRVGWHQPSLHPCRGTLAVNSCTILSSVVLITLSNSWDLVNFFTVYIACCHIGSRVLLNGITFIYFFRVCIANLTFVYFIFCVAEGLPQNACGG